MGRLIVKDGDIYTGIHEYTEMYDVLFRRSTDTIAGKKDVIIAFNEGSYNCVLIDAKETYEYLKEIYEK